jgi:hypothetical protein
LPPNLYSTKHVEETKMAKTSKLKKAPPYLYTGPPPDKEDRVNESDDLYNPDEREQQLRDDGITSAEAGFMQGYTQEGPSKKEARKNAVSHTDEIATELAKEDAEDS